MDSYKLKCDVCDLVYHNGSTFDKICFDCAEKDKMNNPIVILHRFVQSKNPQLSDFEMLELYLSGIVNKLYKKNARVQALRIELDKRFKY